MELQNLKLVIEECTESNDSNQPAAGWLPKLIADVAADHPDAVISVGGVVLSESDKLSGKLPERTLERTPDKTIQNEFIKDLIPSDDFMDRVGFTLEQRNRLKKALVALMLKYQASQMCAAKEQNYSLGQSRSTKILEKYFSQVDMIIDQTE